MEYHRSLCWDLSSLTFLSVTWKMQWSALSSRLQMTPNWDQYTQEQDCHTKGDRLQGWTSRNLMKFNKDKCKVLPLEWTSLLAGHRLGTARMGSNSAGKALEVEWAASWTWSHSVPWQQRGPAASWVYEQEQPADWGKWLLPSAERLLDLIWITFWS